MESQRQVPLRKKDRLGFVGKNLAVVSSVQRTKDIHFNEPSKPGEAPMSNSRFAMNIVSLQDFVLSKTYRKKATNNCGNREQMSIVLGMLIPIKKSMKGSSSMFIVKKVRLALHCQRILKMH